MRIINSPLYKEVIETQHLTIGDFYFFDTIVVAEIKEHTHLGLENSKTFFKIANSFFKNNSFGYVSNRVNKYSVSPLEFGNYCKELINVTSFSAIVYDNYFDKMNALIEKHFLKKPFHVSNDLEDAFNWTKIQVEKKHRIIA